MSLELSGWLRYFQAKIQIIRPCFNLHFSCSWCRARPFHRYILPLICNLYLYLLLLEIFFIIILNLFFSVMFNNHPLFTLRHFLLLLFLLINPATLHKVHNVCESVGKYFFSFLTSGRWIDWVLLTTDRWGFIRIFRSTFVVMCRGVTTYRGWHLFYFSISV